MNAQVPATKSPASQFNTFLKKHKGQLVAALPKHMNAERMMRIALTEFSKNPKLQECDQNSVFASLIISGQLGLEPGVNGQGYLVPYKKTCQFIPGWKGLVDLVSRSGRATVWTGAVYEGDDFDYMLGSEPRCNHRPMGEFDEKKITHVYAIGKVNGAELPVIEVWPVNRVNAHFKKTVIPNLQKYHYSKKHFEMYARKVVLLQVLKYMPQSIELNNAMMVSNAAEQGQSVVIDGDFVNLNANAQQPEPEYQAPQITFDELHTSINNAQAIQHLELVKEQVLAHENNSERVQLLDLISSKQQQLNQQQQIAAPQTQDVTFGGME